MSWSKNLPKRLHRLLKFRRDTLSAERKITEKDARAVAGEQSKEKKGKVDR